MRQVPLVLPFFLALFFAVSGNVFLPWLHLFAFSPFLALLYYKTNFVKSLWIASLCGLAMDLLSSEFRFGLHSLNYCLITLLLYQQKKHFVEDRSLALILFTFIISIVSTLVQFFLISIFGRALPFSAKLLITDLVIMPLADAVYAFIWFTCPMKLYIHIKKVGWKTFYSKLLGTFRFFPKDDKY